MKKTFVSLAALAAALPVLASQADSPLWLRNPAISPDGKTIAFTYKGDIYTVPAAGGAARQLTTDPAYDTRPVWSPDGQLIAFSSTRHGSADIFVVPATGGTPRRLTTSSGSEMPLAFLDNGTVLYKSSDMGSPQAITPPQVAQVYKVSVKGGRPSLYAHVNVGAAAVDAKGRVLYQDRKGYEDPLRKHERSSTTADIWLKDGDKYTKLTDFNGHDMSPAWAGDDAMVYLSERNGTLNVWTAALDGKPGRQLTSFERHPVRSLTRANNGVMAFSWNGELYTLTDNGKPQKVNVSIVADDYNADLTRGFRTNGATTLAVSPDGEQVAFVLRGDLYVTSTKYKTTKRITNTSGQERIASFSPDGRTLVYDSERNGQWGIYQAKIKNASEKTFPYATDIEETLLYAPANGKPAQRPAFSPDGKKVAFLEDRTTLRVIDVATKKVNTALPGKYNYSYSDGDTNFSWSPDSRWFLTTTIGTGGWNNQDVALVKADGSEVVDLTESGYTDGNPRWAMNGRAVTYQTSKYGMRSHGSWGEQEDIMLMVLDPEAWEEFNRTKEEAEYAKDLEKNAKKDEPKADTAKKTDKKGKKAAATPKKDDAVKPLEFDLENRHYRTVRLTDQSALLGDYWMDPKAENLYYVSPAPDGKRNLMARDLKKGDIKVLVPGLSGGLEPDAKSENLFVLSGSGISKVKVPDGKKEAVEFEAYYDRHPSQEREYIYNHMLSQVKDKFYDVNLHGVDWDGYGKDYRRFLPYIDNNYDFAELLSEILGELNASHTGGRYYAPGADMQTATLGAFFAENPDGSLRVLEVLPRGPLATKKAAVKPGDAIVSVDDVQIAPETDVNSLLDGKAGKAVRLGIRRASGAVDYATVKPIGAGTQSDMLYQRWVERNERYVDSISGGKIAYVHVKGMDSPSFRAVYSKLLGKYRNHDAVVVDTRWNGGGWLHNDIALLLNGKENVRYTPRGQYIGSDPFSQWLKPSVMLTNESNYSDAHGTPYVYRTMGIGKLVGAPVPGTMTAVWWETQIDPTLVFGIPQVTALDRNGRALENQQLNPDIEVYNNPAEVAAGTDRQLEAAVRALLSK